MLIAYFYFIYLILLLCVHKEVARNAPALHAGPLRFFARTKKLGKKCFTIWSLRGVWHHISMLPLAYLILFNLKIVLV